MKKAEAYEKAIDELDRRGWTQGVMMSAGTGGVCALGALAIALNGLEEDGGRVFVNRVQLEEYAEPLVKLLPERENIFLHPVAEWNDAPERSVEDVKLLFKRGIEACEEEG